jgi:hypothetical protein
MSAARKFYAARAKLTRNCFAVRRKSLKISVASPMLK